MTRVTFSSTHPVGAETLVDLLRWRSHQHPDLHSFTFLIDGDDEDVGYSYAELDKRARAIAAELQRRDAAGERALLLYPPGLEYIAAFFGCLYAGAVAVPVYPPNPARLERTLPRLQAIARDSSPSIVLTTAAIQSLAGPLATIAPEFQALDWIATDTIEDGAERWVHPAITGQSLAFLQFTSGSTATPKGVMLTHANLLHNSQLIYQAYGHSASSRGVIWLPPYHDMGLIGGILQPLYGGFPVTLMSPVSFLQHPLRWLRAISMTGATTSGGPNFAYDLCVRKITPAQRAELDLSSWQVAFNGAEPLRDETLDQFVEAFGPCGFRREAFYPCYGLAEATLIVSGGAVSQSPVTRVFRGADLAEHHAVDAAGTGDRRTLVSCGQVLGRQQIAIVDPSTLLPRTDGQVGEIWVAGPSVADGYWNNPQATAHTFGARIPGTAAGPFLRTGDLGFLREGELFVTGRLKDLIIVRGRNHYPQDIELTAERSHPALRSGCSAAFAIEVAGAEQLAIVLEVERQFRPEAADGVIQAIRQAIALTHDLHAYAVCLLKTGSIPKTSSGKIQRHACRSGFLAGTLEVVGSSISQLATALPEVHLTAEALHAAPPAARPAVVEGYLRALIARMLALPLETIDPAQPIRALGLDSLMAIELVQQIEIDLQLVVPMALVLQDGDIAGLAATLLAQLAAPAATPIPNTGARDVFPLSAGQAALWFLHRLAPESAAYNIACAARLPGDVDRMALRRAFQALVDRHPMLRTRFVPGEDGPQQRVTDREEVAFFEGEIAGMGEAELAERLADAARRPFDLAGGPLFRVELFARPAHPPVLLLSMHHIIADLWSLEVLLEEVSALYTAEQAGQPATLPPTTIHYADYVAWQRAWLSSAEGERQRAYWSAQLADAPPALALPADRQRPPVQSFHGGTYTGRLDSALIQQFRALGSAHGATLYMIMLAAFQAYLHRSTGQTDIVIGSPTSGRNRAQFAPLIGYLVNPLAIRLPVSGDQPFAELLQAVRRTVLDAFAHQDYPFAQLVEHLVPTRDPSRSPLFQVMLVYEQSRRVGGIAPFLLETSTQPLELGSLRLEPQPIARRTAQFDLTLTAVEEGQGLAFAFEYNADLFDPPTIARMAGHFQALLAAIAAQPGLAIAELPWLTEAERRTLLVDWNATARPYPTGQRIHDLFDAQAARTPDLFAVVCGDTHLTYRELDRRANQLAHYLQRLGVGPEVRVGICVKRSLELLVGLLGILKAGGAYVPLDPAYPPDRLAFMLEDSQAAVLITLQEPRTKNQEPPTEEPRTKPALSSGKGNQEPDREDSGSRFSVLGSKGHVIELDRDWPMIAQQPATSPESGAAPDNLAYVIYTSGSTGRPKGVAIEHRSAVTLLHWARETFSPAELAGVLASTAISFDLSVFECFAPLSWGGTVILVDTVLDLLRMSLVVDVTLVNTVPSAMTELLRLGALPASVQTVNLAGEPLQNRLVQQIYAQSAATRVFNLYGPSEDTTYSTAALIERGAEAEPAIGRPIANTQLYVLNERRQPVPVGVAGEIYIGGAGLARGYLNRPELTAERFVLNPFAPTTDDPFDFAQGRRRPTTDDREPRTENQEPFSPAVGGQWSAVGGRLYRTGDLARYRPDGAIEYLGRIDHQVKLRGFRIELPEIEAVLHQHGAVREAVVLAREDVPGDRRLVAYVVPNQEPRTKNQEPEDAAEIGSRFSVLGSEVLRQFLRDRLPDYMVPAAFVQLDVLPLTPNGKIDRQALPAPSGRPELARAYAAPRTPTEVALATIWAELLRVDRVGTHDNFFELGGHSLLATRIIDHVRRAFHVDLPVTLLFTEPTVAGLATAIEQQQRKPANGDRPGIVARRRGNQQVDQLIATLQRRAAEHEN